MFTQKIIDSDAFLEMPTSAQALYFHLNMRADDDGFVNNPKKITRYVGAAEDDLKLLLLKRFIIGFDSGVIVIKHWRMHNTLKTDRYRPTDYQEELATLRLKENKAYTDKPVALESGTGLEPEWKPDGTNMEPERNQSGTGLEPQNRIDKISIDKNRLEESLTVSKETVCRTKDVRRIVEAWNSLGLNEVREVTGESKRGGMLRARVKEHGVDGVLEAIENVRKSDFLKGQNAKGFVITFDWFVKPNNFIKVLEGNYNDLHEPDAGHGNSRKPKQYTTAENYKAPKAPDTVQDLWDKVNKI